MGEAMPLAGPEAGPSAEERQWAMLAHLSVLLNLVTALGGPIAAFLIYFIGSDPATWPPRRCRR
jgi:uncharacterized Tic20 family protein